MLTYLHIGYPKNFSTSLQRSFFSVHPELYHLGIGVGSNIGYQDETISSIFEVYLKTAKTFKYREKKAYLKAHIEKHIKKATELNKAAVGVSSEHISFSFTPDGIDFSTKIQRFVDLFGSDVKVIMIVREQLSLLKSLYQESVRVGLPYTYQEFLYSIYKYQDRNYFYDLRYDLVYEELCKVFGQSNVLVEVFEEHREKDGTLVSGNKSPSAITEKISDFLRIKALNKELEHFNEKLDLRVLVAKYRLNKTTSHDLGNDLYQSAESHRQRDYFMTEIDLVEEEKLAYRDVLIKRRLLSEASCEANNISQQDIDELFKVDPKLYDKIKHFYNTSNIAFAEQLNATLPPAYTGS